MDCCSLVSIGMPVYNGEKWLRRSLDSLLLQDYKNIEIIISDNASEDSTFKICSEYREVYKSIKILRQQTTRLIIDNFKAVLDEARGDYFIWAAVDDYWESSFVSKLVAEIEKDDHYAVAQSATAKVSEQNFSPFGFVRFNGKLNPAECSALQLTNKIVSPLKYNFYIYGLFKRELLVEAFAYIPHIPSSDRWFLLQFALAGYKFAYVDEPLYVRTIREEPVYVRYKNDDYGKQIKKVEKIWFRFDALPVVRKMLFESSLVPGSRKYLIPVILLQLFVGRIKLGLRLMMKSAVINFLPENIVQYIIKKRRARNLYF